MAGKALIVAGFSRGGRPAGLFQASGGVDASKGDPVGEEIDSLQGSRGAGRSLSNTLFVDGIADSVGYHQVRKLFASYGRLWKVFVQRFKKVGRRFRFGFVHFSLWNHASAAINALDRKSVV